MKQLCIIAVLMGSAISFSCTKKASPAKTAAPEVPAVTYTNNVKALIQAKCTPCHIPAEGGRKAPLDTYAATQKSIDGILTRVQLAPTERGYMPFKKQPLTAEEITLLKNWKAAGSPE